MLMITKKLENALKELNKIQVIDKSLHEIKNEILEVYIGNIRNGWKYKSW